MPNRKIPEIPAYPKQALPRWAIEEYAGEETDMANDIYSAVFWNDVAKLKLDGKSKPAGMEVWDWFASIVVKSKAAGEDAVLTARLAADAMISAAQKIEAVREKSTRSFLRIVWELKRQNRWQAGSAEYSSLQEMLIDRIARFHPDSLDGTNSELSDTLFFLEEMMPIFGEMKDDALSAEALLAFKENFAKARRAVPYLRRAVHEYQGAATVHEKPIRKLRKQIHVRQRLMGRLAKDGEPWAVANKERQALEKEVAKLEAAQVALVKGAEKVYKKKLENVVELVTSKKTVASHGPNSIGQLLKYDADTQVFVGHEANAREDVLFYVRVPTKYEKAVISALKPFVDFHVTDPKAMINDIKEALQPDKE